MRIKSLIIAGVMALAALSTAACGQRIKFDEAAVEVREAGGDAGVQEQEITTGRYFNHWWSMRYIVKFPTTVQTYTWDQTENCFSFINGSRVSTVACLSIQTQIEADKADNIVRKYRGAIMRGGGEDGYVLDDVINGPVRRQLQNILNYTGNRYTAEQLYADGGRALAADVRRELIRQFGPDGIVVIDVLWAKPPGLPQPIVNSIQGALQAQTDARRATAELERTVAEGNKRRAEADADAYVIATQARAIAQNPAILDLREIELGLNICPRNASTCVIGANAAPFLNEARVVRNRRVAAARQ